MTLEAAPSDTDAGAPFARVRSSRPLVHIGTIAGDLAMVLGVTFAAFIASAVLELHEVFSGWALRSERSMTATSARVRSHAAKPSIASPASATWRWSTASSRRFPFDATPCCLGIFPWRPVAPLVSVPALS